MKRYSRLFEQIACFSNLYHAAQKAFRGKKGKLEVATFYFHLETELLRLEEELISGKYTPSPYFHFVIYEPKERKIFAAPFRDRVVHHAICNIMEPLWEKTMIEDSYACRKGKGVQKAIQKVQKFCQSYPYYLQLDIRKYFDSIDHKVLSKILRKKIKDRALLELLDRIIDYPTCQEVQKVQERKGIPIGNLTSQHFANLYLGELDQLIKNELRVKGHVRYMDDFICFAKTKNQLDEWYFEICQWLQRELCLELKGKATKLAPVSEGVNYLGIRIFRGILRIQPSRGHRFQRKLQKQEKQFLQGKLTEEQFLDSARGLLEQVRWTNSFQLRRSLFKNRLALYESIL